MLCQDCNKRPATVHLTKVINNQRTDLYLCQECARKRGDISVFTPFSINDLLASFLDMGNSSASLGKEDMQKCNTCGMNYAQFKKTSRLGCEDCYKQFQTDLDPILKRMQAGVEHNGKVPKRAGIDLRLKRKIQELKGNLDKAVKHEEFEEAARIRDEIRALEKQIKNG
ncbi:MAG: UvrB/UvrC motif-containing protein [Xylanivirga thermophila]|jgi:protein arginine kinase activator|uniref:UvrB/UvrC motif-containing protein n=1 Tax=Xylanivirga thermophila TaxID=2496273 RepID=UPI00101BA9CD|nr:UvrB/UvrC motif-containing protein [Xylanivirga thermophila]